jgi:amidohydrolase
MISPNTIKKDVGNIFNYIKKIRNTIHQYPELSFQEYKTSRLITYELDRLNIEYQKVLDTGIVAKIGNDRKCIALRADIDALPVTEETGVEFISKAKGIMHACGHDTHTAMLLGAARLLKKYEKGINGCILFIFQPGEEKLPGGALQIIETGILNNPKPEFIYGQHVYPAGNTGTVSIGSGYVMASADELYWTIKGKEAHAAQPHLGNNPLTIAADIIAQSQTLLNSTKKPTDSAVLTITSIHGGAAPNIIPNEVKISGTLRTFNNELRYELLKKIEEISLRLATNSGCECDFSPEIGYPPLKNDKIATKIAENTALDLLGNEKTKYFEPKMWAEDFSYYYEKAGIPSCFWFLGVKPEHINEMPGLHHSQFLPEEEAMLTGTAMLISVALNSLKQITST